MKAYPYMHKHPTSGQTTMSDGMDLRDYFAAVAMPQCFAICATTDTAAKEAYRMADAMLKAREVKDVQE
jgi:hypothetical protein